MGHDHSSAARIDEPCSNRQLFEGILWFLRPGVPVGQIYRTHILTHLRVGLDDVVGKKTGRGYGCGTRL